MTKDTSQRETDCVLPYWRFGTMQNNHKWLLRKIRRVCVCACVCVCDYESFRSVQVLCISPGLGEQTDTDTPVAPKSALLPKPNDVKRTVCVCVCMCVCVCVCVLAIHMIAQWETRAKLTSINTLINTPACTQTQKAGSYIQSVPHVGGKYGCRETTATIYFVKGWKLLRK